MDKKTIDTYNRMTKEYDDETIDFWNKFPRTFFDEFAKRAKGKVLDIGSGPGRDGLLLKQMGLDVICLDASEAMVTLCREKGLLVVEGDFNKLPFDRDYFDGVWAYTSLLHVKKSEVQKAVKEIVRVLKTGGIFALGIIEGDGQGYRESLGINKPRWFSFYIKQEIEDLLIKNGFKIIYFESFKPGSKNYLNFIAQKI